MQAYFHEWHNNSMSKCEIKNMKKMLDNFCRLIYSHKSDARASEKYKLGEHVAEI